MTTELRGIATGWSKAMEERKIIEELKNELIKSLEEKDEG